jgi:ABC transporter
MTAIIEARGVVKSFGPTPALRGASVGASAGEILAVMGPSGSGKSTLLHCLAGILAPDDGQVWFAGRRVDELREAERSKLRRDTFGFVFQFGQLVPELTAEENIALPLLLGGARRASAIAEARAWFGRMGLDGGRPGARTAAAPGTWTTCTRGTTCASSSTGGPPTRRKAAGATPTGTTRTCCTIPRRCGTAGPTRPCTAAGPPPRSPGCCAGTAGRARCAHAGPAARPRGC